MHFTVFSLQYLFTKGSYEKPLFTTYFKTSLFSIYLVAFIFWRPWQRLCGCGRKRRQLGKEAGPERSCDWDRKEACQSNEGGGNCMGGGGGSEGSEAGSEHRKGGSEGESVDRREGREGGEDERDRAITKEIGGDMNAEVCASKVKFDINGEDEGVELLPGAECSSPGTTQEVADSDAPTQAVADGDAITQEVAVNGRSHKLFRPQSGSFKQCALPKPPEMEVCLLVSVPVLLGIRRI